MDVESHALHGFLGRPGDWSFLPKARKWDLFSSESLKQETLSEWGKWLNQKVSGTSNLLIGYSLGGRLGLHALLANPNIWRGAIFISTHPGLQTSLEKKMRLESDRNWAHRFLTDPWDRLMNDWNDQPVFQNDRSIRIEGDYNRADLFKAITQWSLGHQEDLCQKITALPMPILWITGELDDKFQKISKRLCFSHPKSQFCVAQQVGHRIISTKHQFIKDQVAEFKESLC